MNDVRARQAPWHALLGEAKERGPVSRPATSPPIPRPLRGSGVLATSVTWTAMANGAGRTRHVAVACDDVDLLHPGRGGCGRPITEITAGPDGNVIILGPVLAQNADPGGTLTTMVPGMRIVRRRGAAVIDSTNPADRHPPTLRTDLLEARRLAHQAGVPFPDGVPYSEAVAAEIAKHERLTSGWDPTGASSRVGRRTFRCLCGRSRTSRADPRPGSGTSQGEVPPISRSDVPPVRWSRVGWLMRRTGWWGGAQPVAGWLRLEGS